MHRNLNIDLLRGAAVVCMVQFHTIDSFASAATKATWLGQLSVFFGGGAAPLFLTLAGVAGALSKNNLRRGVEVFSVALLFRVQEWALGGDGASSTSLLRVDVLNCIGVSLVFLSVVRNRWARLACAAIFIGAAPWVEGYYLGGTDNFQLFPMFPWTGYACAGAAFVMFGSPAPYVLGAYGLIVAARLLFPEALRFAALNDNIVFTLERLTCSLGLLAVSHLFPKALLRLGRHSLLIYWVHVELVYGLWFHGKKATLSPLAAALAACGMLGAMWLLSYRPRRMVT